MYRFFSLSLMIFSTIFVYADENTLTVENIELTQPTLDNFENVYTNKNGCIAWIFPRCNNGDLTYSNTREDATLYMLNQKELLNEISIRHLIMQTGYKFRNLKGVKIFDLTENDNIVMGVEFNYTQTETNASGCFRTNSDVILFVGNNEIGFNHLFLDTYSVSMVKYYKNGIFKIGHNKIIRIIDSPNPMHVKTQ